ncbi:sulfur carrier protein ThiS [Vibrio sp. S4M6]|uniref:sulfur carrier protein ThiS n=1 Tax=Vibrio sinus TaxID=2946865 RepID=UPI00202A8890|nr:sulfur carrier protein ThiS [Vibrio sinus]MCL9782856.1 sulfur carrier protein ThiS [Vibrio sinus]
MTTITITVNGEPKRVANGENLNNLIRQFALPEQGCVFTVNNAIVPRSEWSSTLMSNGDTISLFQAIAGG